jgi:hypothetical protein
MSTKPMVDCLAPGQEGRKEASPLSIRTRAAMKEGREWRLEFGTAGSQGDGNGFVKSSKKKEYVGVEGIAQGVCTDRDGRRRKQR